MPTRDNVGSIVASSDIESIQVLKDASSAAIYGAQAANGVIIITTKKAKKGEIKVNFDMSLTAQMFSTGIDLLNTRQWADCYWQAYQNGNNGNNPNSAIFGNGDTPVIAQTYTSGNKTMKVADTDWAKEIYSTALKQNYNLSLARGGENGGSSLSVNYMDHDGMCRNTDYKSFNTRLSGDYHFLDNRLRIGENLAVTRWTTHNAPRRNRGDDVQAYAYGAGLCRGRQLWRRLCGHSQRLCKSGQTHGQRSCQKARVLEGLRQRIH